jgi:hypothetical protein
MQFRKPFQFSRRTFPVVLTAFAVWLGLYVHRTRMQEDAVQAIHNFGGWVRYDFQYPTGSYSVKDFDPKAKSGVPKWLLDRLGLDFFHSVVYVSLIYSTDSGKREENSNPSDKALQHLPKLPNLRTLLLAGTQASDASMRHLAKLKRLEQLYMWDVSKVSDIGVQHLKHLTNLEGIHISESRISVGALRVFGQLKEIESLSVQGNHFTDTGLSYLANSTKLKVLWVGLGPNQITDEGICHLCQLEELETLGLQNTHVTAKGLERLSTLRNLKSLFVTKRELGDTTQLAEILKGCKIE